MTPEERLQGQVEVENLVVLEELLFLVDQETWKEWRDYLAAANQRLKIPTRVQVWNEWRLKKAERKEQPFKKVVFMYKLCRAVESSLGGLGKPPRESGENP